MAALTLLAVLGGFSSAGARESDCELRLAVELTPDVPNVRDEGFLSSLLSNHPGYRLELLGAADSSLIEVDLSGPGPEYRCQDVIDTMRKDSRIEAIQIESPERLAAR